jgi:hypothetical protein
VSERKRGYSKGITDNNPVIVAIFVPLIFPSC